MKITLLYPVRLAEPEGPLQLYGEFDFPEVPPVDSRIVLPARDSEGHVHERQICLVVSRPPNFLPITNEIEIYVQPLLEELHLTYRNLLPQNGWYDENEYWRRREKPQPETIQ